MESHTAYYVEPTTIFQILHAFALKTLDLSLGFTASWILLMCFTSLLFTKDYCWDFKNLSPQPTKTWILKDETNYMLSHLQCAIILQIL